MSHGNFCARHVIPYTAADNCLLNHVIHALSASGRLGRDTTGRRGVAWSAWPSGKAWLLPSWSEGLYKNTRAVDFIQASLYISVALSLHVLILTFENAIQGASSTDLSEILCGLRSSGGRPALYAARQGWSSSISATVKLKLRVQAAGAACCTRTALFCSQRYPFYPSAPPLGLSSSLFSSGCSKASTALSPSDMLLVLCPNSACRKLKGYIRAPQCTPWASTAEHTKNSANWTLFHSPGDAYLSSSHLSPGGLHPGGKMQGQTSQFRS